MYWIRLNRIRNKTVENGEVPDPEESIQKYFDLIRKNQVRCDGATAR